MPQAKRREQGAHRRMSQDKNKCSQGRNRRQNQRQNTRSIGAKQCLDYMLSLPQRKATSSRHLMKHEIMNMRVLQESPYRDHHPQIKRVLMTRVYSYEQRYLLPKCPLIFFSLEQISPPVTLLLGTEFSLRTKHVLSLCHTFCLMHTIHFWTDAVIPPLSRWENPSTENYIRSRRQNRCTDQQGRPLIRKTFYGILCRRRQSWGGEIGHPPRPWKHEDLRSHPQDPWKKSDLLAFFCYPSTGEVGKRGFLGLK